MPKETVESLKNRLETFRSKLVPKKEKARKIGLLVDGPNMLRKEFAIDLEEIRDILKEYGSIKVGKVFLNQYASDKLMEAIENQGFESMISFGDVDVRLAIEATELILNPNIDTIALVTRDADFKPILNKAKQHGKETIIFGAEPGFSIALKNSADYVIILNEEQETPPRGVKVPLPVQTLMHNGNQ